jgi:hypothetical protein
VGKGLLYEVPRSHTLTPNSVGLLWTSDRPVAKTLPDNTQHSQETDIHARGGIFFLRPVFSFDPFCPFKSFPPSSCHLCSILLSLYNKHNTNIHAPGGIRTNNPSKRTAVDPRLRPRGHWDRLTQYIPHVLMIHIKNQKLHLH